MDLWESLTGVKFNGFVGEFDSLSLTAVRFRHQACLDTSRHYPSQSLCCYLAVQ